MIDEGYNAHGHANGNGNGNGHVNGNGASTRLHNSYVIQLADIRAAERQAAEVFPDMAVVARDEDVVSAFRAALADTEIQIERLEQLIDALDITVGNVASPALEGVRAEARSVLQGNGDAEDLDGALLRTARQSLRYQIAGYEAACATARRLGDYRTLDTLLQSLDEELALDSSLSGIASRRSRLSRTM